MKIMPINTIRNYNRNKKQLNRNILTQPQDTVSFSGANIQRFIGRTNTLEKIQKDLEKAIKENNVKEILEYFNIKCEVNKNNLLTISHYSPSVNYLRDEQSIKPEQLYFSELGINENNLFKKIIAIKNEAFFMNSKLTDLGELKKIGGDASFDHSKISNLKNLEIIGGNAYFFLSPVENLGALKTIERCAFFNGSKVTDLGKLETIGKTLDLSNTKITNLGKLTSVGSRLKEYSPFSRNIPKYVIKLNEYINPKEAEHLVVGRKAVINIISEKAKYKMPANTPKIIEKTTNNQQNKNNDKKTSFVQRLKNTWKALKGN